MSLLLTILLPLTAFLFPLAVYCLILAFINRSPRPVVLPGTLDFAGVLFAASGFLLLGGPFILSGLYTDRRQAWALGHAQLLPGAGDESWYFWAALWVFYFLVVLGGSVLLLRKRQHMTSIYNIAPAVLEEILAQVLDNLHWKWDRSGHRVQIESADSLTHPTSAVLHVDPFPMMRHVSLYWNDPAHAVRAEVEAELTRALAEVHTGYNPAGTWLLSTAASLFLISFFGLVLFVVGVVTRVIAR